MVLLPLREAAPLVRAVSVAITQAMLAKGKGVRKPREAPKPKEFGKGYVEPNRAGLAWHDAQGRPLLDSPPLRMSIPKVPKFEERYSGWKPPTIKEGVVNIPTQNEGFTPWVAPGLREGVVKIPTFREGVTPSELGRSRITLAGLAKEPTVAELEAKVEAAKEDLSAAQYRATMLRDVIDEGPWLMGTNAPQPTMFDEIVEMKTATLSQALHQLDVARAREQRARTTPKVPKVPKGRR